ncbi:lipopolysaccharide biosynthesis protein [Planococcus rifietoensis]|uniref:lipopolysaccharide biosynthesis protein n=1 Tax=Planococcus rifietoensis TaxID=200991 RepID=UPI0032187EA1
MKTEKSSERTTKTLNGFVWSGIGTFLQVASKFVVLIVLARLLTPEDFGLVSAAMIIISFSIIFSTIGIGPALVQKSELEEVHIEVGYTLSLIFSFFVTILIWILADPISAFFNMPSIALIVKILSITFFIQGFSLVGQALLERDMNFKVVARIQVISYILGFGLTSIVLAYLNAGIWSLIAGHIMQTLIQTLSVLILQPHSKKLKFSMRHFKELTYFGGGFTLARIFNFLALQGDNIVIGKFLGPVALGYYGRAYQLMVMPANLFGQVLDKVLFPAMAQIQDDKKKLYSIFLKGTSVISLIVMPFSVYLVIYAEEIVLVLFGADWSQVTVPFMLLAIGMLFRASYKVSESVARATGAVYRRAWRQFVYALAVIIGSYIGHFWELNGIALGITIAILVNFVLMSHLSISLLNGSWQTFLKVHLPSLALSTTLLVILLMTNSFIDMSKWNNIWVLLFSTTLSGGTIILSVKLFPRFYLGKEGEWILKTLNKYIKKFKRKGEGNAENII